MWWFVGECYYGFGEKFGFLERFGCWFEMCNFDVLGYDVCSIDFFYKYIFFIIIDCGLFGVYGFYYDIFVYCWFDFGNEKDYYYLLFWVFWV